MPEELADTEPCNPNLSHLEKELDRHCKNQEQNLIAFHKLVSQLQNPTEISDLLDKSLIPGTCGQLRNMFETNHYYAVQQQEIASKEFKACIEREQELAEKIAKAEELKFGNDAKKHQEKKLCFAINKAKLIFQNLSRMAVVDVGEESEVFTVTVVFEGRTEYPVKFVINEGQVLDFDAGSLLTPPQIALLKEKTGRFHDISAVVCILRKLILKKNKLIM